MTILVDAPEGGGEVGLELVGVCVFGIICEDAGEAPGGGDIGCRCGR